MMTIVAWFIEWIISLFLGSGVVKATDPLRLRKIRRHAPSARLIKLQISLTQEDYAGISFIALRRLQVYIRLPQSSPPSTGFLPEGPTGSQPPFYESQKLIAWASRTSFFRYLSIPVGYRNHFLGCRRLGYPEGSDSPSIRPSMLANSRRVRWLSANNNQ